MSIEALRSLAVYLITTLDLRLFEDGVVVVFP